MGIVRHSAIADHDIGLPMQDRGYQRRYIAAFVLPVAIGVNDDIRTFGQCAVHSAAKGCGKAAVPAV